MAIRTHGELEDGSIVAMQVDSLGKADWISTYSVSPNMEMRSGSWETAPYNYA